MPDARAVSLSAVPPRMTRCECAGLSFEEVRRRIAGSAIPLEAALERVGCGQICTACVPDLAHYFKAPRAVPDPE